MKRLLLMPFKIFVFAIQNAMFGILGIYALIIGFISIWISSGFKDAVICLVMILLIFFVLKVIIVGRDNIDKKIRKKQKMKELYEYLLK